VPIQFVGVRDRFGQSGVAEELIEHYGLGKEAIKVSAQRVLLRKTR